MIDPIELIQKNLKNIDKQTLSTIMGQVLEDEFFNMMKKRGMRPVDLHTMDAADLLIGKNKLQIKKMPWRSNPKNSPCGFRSSTGRLTIDLYRSAGGRCHKPYDAKDFDFLVLGNSSYPELKDWYIVPKTALTIEGSSFKRRQSFHIKDLEKFELKKMLKFLR